MKWITVLLLFGVSSATLAQNPNDPTTYPDTIVVSSSRLETVVVETTTQGQRPPLFPPLVQQRPTVTTKDKTKTYYDVIGVIGDTKYSLQGGPGVPLGTFPAKTTNGQYADILVTRADGSRHNVGFRIVSEEKIVAQPSVLSSGTPGAKPIAEKTDDNSVMIFYWANDLNTICQMASPITTGMGLPGTTTEFLKSDTMQKLLEYKTDQGLCVGYILGRAEALTEMANPSVVAAIEKVCFPLHNPADELVDEVKKKLATEATLHDKQVTASIAVDLALKELFPCPAK